jgi:2-deoxy-D-gluconate 3-dehydrogenase
VKPGQFNDKVVVVTGASRGIGQAICAAFGKQGATVVGVARSDLAATAAAVSAAGGTFAAHKADLGSGTQSAAAAVIGAILAKTGKIDALINNAGIIRRAPAKDYSEQDWQAVIATNLNSPFFLMQAVARWWIETGRAQAPAEARLKLVNIASLLSFQGGITVPAYAASKHALAGVTKALANEWARERINVNAIAPGYIVTENTKALLADPVRNQAILDRIPEARWGQPVDIAEPVVFLASPEADYMNGAIISVDGGWLAR